jgi:ABC-type lipopolysaccharide export system ATPase subunit
LINKAVDQIEITQLTRARRQAAGVSVCLHDQHRMRANRSMLEILAAAIEGEPRVLVLDEPFNGLPGKLPRQVMLAMLRKCQEAGCGILMADQDIRAALHVVDRAYLIHRGEIMAGGSPDELMGQKGD